MNFEFRPDDLFQSKALAGLFGALVSLKWAPGDSKWEKCLTVFSGTVAAIYLPPPFLHWLGLRELDGIGLGAAFFMGMFAMNWMASLVDWIKTGRWVELLPWRSK